MFLVSLSVQIHIHFLLILRGCTHTDPVYTEKDLELDQLSINKREMYFGLKNGKNRKRCIISCLCMSLY